MYFRHYASHCLLHRIGQAITALKIIRRKETLSTSNFNLPADLGPRSINFLGQYKTPNKP
jgi:hypothetical protein